MLQVHAPKQPAVPHCRLSMHFLPAICINADAATSVPVPGAVRVLGKDAVGAGAVLAAISHGDADNLRVGASEENPLGARGKQRSYTGVAPEDTAPWLQPLVLGSH